MKPPTLTGAITALATPFRGKAVSYADLKRLVDHQLRGGIDGVVPVGTTGESPTLSHEEHMDVVRATIEFVRGRVPVIAGTGSNSTAEALELTRLSDEAGADAVLVVAPVLQQAQPGGPVPALLGDRRGDRPAGHPVLHTVALRDRDRRARWSSA